MKIRARRSRFNGFNLPACTGDKKEYRKIWCRLYRAEKRGLLHRARKSDGVVRTACTNRHKRQNYMTSRCIEFVKNKHPEVFKTFRAEAFMIFENQKAK